MSEQTNPTPWHEDDAEKRRRTIEIFEQMHGRTPTEEELSKHLHLLNAVLAHPRLRRYILIGDDNSAA